MLSPKLEYLECFDNKITELPEFNDNLKYLQCSHNRLTRLPVFNANLEYVHCSYNEITYIPIFNEKLQIFNCSVNRLINLPPFNKELYRFHCNDNQLTDLPILTDNLKSLYFKNNCIKYLNNRDDINTIKHKQTILTKGKRLLCNLKIKYKFHNWLWEHIRQRLMQERYHPSKLIQLLSNTEDDDTDSLCNIINEW